MGGSAARRLPRAPPQRTAPLKVNAGVAADEQCRRMSSAAATAAENSIIIASSAAVDHARIEGMKRHECSPSSIGSAMPNCAEM